MDEGSPKKASSPAKQAGKKMDVATIFGLLVAIAGILGGLLLEGGKFRDIAQLTAGLIVMCGTSGAVMLSTPMPVLLGAAHRFLGVFVDSTQPLDALLEEMIGYATKARK